MNKEEFKKIILDWYHEQINIPIVHTVSLDDEKRSDFIYSLLEQNNHLELFEDLYIETDPMNQFIDRFKIKKVLKNGSNKEAATLVGKLIAEKAIEKGIKKVVFDRSGFLYHGRIKALADGARQNGLEF